MHIALNEFLLAFPYGTFRGKPNAIIYLAVVQAHMHGPGIYIVYFVYVSICVE